ncbi:DUF2147 domain-containing protein [Janthinobacterium sp. 17J80-10]|uniref:DUF2147 domain-containing protein n=1 Tax=Janthinobacterium sp. 17J80-10 TaxID=2497863 RepID=UPI001005654D|nr:DUF2147 domain-containing protein [Janthinobacterium sp. 17J80-10]QAU35747.1 DUF2147 domain-containing protein [Janthinobacterium sp. 17J80-10]
MKISSLWLLAAGFGTCLAAWAQASPAGLWKTIDDETGKPRALVRISESGGEFRGKIEKLFRTPEQDPNPKCDKCEGSNRDQPKIGMTVISGMRLDGSEYTGGQILDTESGKVYKSKMSLQDDGKKLNVRGYIGMPMFGRSQTWLREE